MQIVRVLVTGGAGFIGSYFARYVLSPEQTERKVSSLTVVDSFTYASDIGRLQAVSSHEKFNLVKGDIRDPDLMTSLIQDHDLIFNFAAESHVDNSLKSPNTFIETNTVGVQVLLNCLRSTPSKRLVQVSTDEVYGEVMGDPATETDSMNPSSPYSASKAAGELMIFAANRSFGQNYVITRGCNTYGFGQNPEKVIPRFLNCINTGNPLPLYGDGLQVREWIHVSDHVRGIWLAGISDYSEEVFNLGTGFRLSNRDLIEIMKKYVDGALINVESVQDRPGHDRRYAIDSNKAYIKLGFKPQYEFERGLADLIAKSLVAQR